MLATGTFCSEDGTGVMTSFGRPRLIYLLVLALLVLGFFGADLLIGASAISPRDVFAALVSFDPENFDHFIVVYQRLPHALIASYVGAVMAMGGIVLQGITRNPLSSPASLGINAGATMFVVVSVFIFDFGIYAQGFLGLCGAVFGFGCCVLLSRLTGAKSSGSGLAFIVSGALVSMMFFGISNAILLSDPAKRSDYLGWIAGNINHVYVDRLYLMAVIGGVSTVILLYLARPLTLITLGQEKATSIGVNVSRVSWVALICVMLGGGSAVAICGPIGFVGLIVPHIVRPVFGINFAFNLPASALFGALVVLAADIIARSAFSPFILHTGLIMDLVGGVVFAFIVRRYYVMPKDRGTA